MMWLSNLYFLVPLGILGVVYGLIGRKLWLRPQRSSRDRAQRHTIKMLVTMSQVQQAMALLISAFHKYSGKEGDKTTLSKGELKDLLYAELGEILGKNTDQAKIDKIFKDLDANSDGSVDFQEYVTLVACLTMVCNEFFTKK
uniref:Protein S100 n=2 Tax=Oncorhynchus tshawytscha TaxID=74940 RepID=A0AAZ3RCA7_ONCTS